MKRILAAVLAALLCLGLCACGDSSGDMSPTSPTAFAGLEDQIDAAREEGRLTVCVSGDEPFMTAACEKFEELFGIHVTVRTVEAGRLPRSSGADVWYGGNEALCRALSEEGTLMTYTPAASADLSSPEYDHGDYCAINVDALGIMVNDDVLDRMGISAPRTWDDLLNPVYRELVWLPAYDTAEGRLFVRAVMAQYGDGAADYLAKLDTSVQFYTTGINTAAKCLPTGECVIGIGWLSTALAVQRDTGSSVIRMWAPAPSGVPGQVQTTAVFADAPHPNAAKLWQEFALSPLCMELMTENGCDRFPTVWDGQETMLSLEPAQLETYAAEDEETVAAVDEVIADVLETLAENGVDTENPARWGVA